MTLIKRTLAYILAVVLWTWALLLLQPVAMGHFEEPTVQQQDVDDIINGENSLKLLFKLLSCTIDNQYMYYSDWVTTEYEGLAEAIECKEWNTILMYVYWNGDNGFWEEMATEELTNRDWMS